MLLPPADNRPVHHVRGLAADLGPGHRPHRGTPRNTPSLVSARHPQQVAPAASDEPAHLRVPPHALEAEQSVLGALLLDNAAFARAAPVLPSTDFFRREHQVIYEAIAAVLSRGEAADVLTVFDQLEGEVIDYGGLPYLNQLAQSVPSTSNLLRYAEIVRDRSRLRALIGEADRITAAAFEPGAKAATVIGEGHASIARLSRDAEVGPGRLALLTLDELERQAAAVRWSVKSRVPADAIGMLFGASGSFKSFVAIDLALHVAHGLPWLGRRTRKGSVIYIAAEGGGGLALRVRAWHRARGLPSAGIVFRVVKAAVDLNAEAWRIVEAAKSEGIEPALVVIDTLSQTYRGDENSAGEMAAYLSALGESFRRLWACTVLLVHHTGHAATERPRGSSTLTSNCDFLLGSFRDADQMLATLTCEKLKDGERFEDASFALAQHTLGVDADGDPITSLVARHLSSSDDVQEALQGEAKAGRLSAYQLLLSLLHNGMRESELRKAFYEDCTMKPDAARQAYTRARNRGIKDGHFDLAQGRVITLKGTA